MEINQNAPLVSQQRVLIQAPRATVWRLLTEIERWPTWQQSIGRATLDGPLAIGTQFHWTSGGAPIDSQIAVLEDQRRLGWSGRTYGMVSQHIWELTDQDGGTLVTTAESMSGWLIYPVKLLMPSFLSGALDTWLATLKAAAEGQTQPAPASDRLAGLVAK